MADARGGRSKRSRLGRGLSAMLDTPKAVEVEVGAESEQKPIIEKAEEVQREGREERKEREAGASGSEVISGSGVEELRKDREDTLTSEQVSGTGTGGSGGVDPDVGGAEVVGSEGASGERVVEIGVGLICANTEQPRRVFEEGALKELADSIARHGVMSPVLVRERVGVSEGEARYELIAGERRWRASVMAGLGVVPAIVREVDDAVSAQLALIENIMREDLNPIERAQGLRALADRHGMTQQAISESVGMSRSGVANSVRLLELPENLVTLIAEGALSAGHGKALLSLGKLESQRKFASMAIKEGWNVRRLEQAIEHELSGMPGDKTPLISGETAEDGANRATRVLRDLERRAGESLGTRVRIRTDRSGKKGRLTIEFYDLDQFDGLLSKLGVSSDI